MSDGPRHSGRVPRPRYANEPTLGEVSQQVADLARIVSNQSVNADLSEKRTQLRIQESEFRTATRIVGVVSKVDALRAEHAERISAVEKTLPQKAAGIAGAGFKLGGYTTLIIFVGNLTAKHWPQFGDLIKSIIDSIPK